MNLRHILATASLAMAAAQAQVAPSQGASAAAGPAVAPSQTLSAPPVKPPASPLAARLDSGKELSALITADREATLSAQMAGKIKKISLSIGQAFKAGSNLVEFDCEEAQAKLDALNADYLGARETHLAKLRLQGLGAAGDLEVTLAAAAGEKAKSQVKQQESQLAFCVIKAPYAGRVVRLKAKQAESVAPNQPIVEIVAEGALKATVNVPASLAVGLKLGSPLTIQFREGGPRHAAKISRLNARIDGVSQSMEVEAVFTGKGAGAGVLPGMIGRAVFP